MQTNTYKIDKRNIPKEYKKAAFELMTKQYDDKWYLYCERCWITETLSTHHIIFKSERPKHKEINNIRNLFICCMGCHEYFHKHKLEARKDLVEERKLEELFWILNKY